MLELEKSFKSIMDVIVSMTRGGNAHDRLEGEAGGTGEAGENGLNPPCLITEMMGDTQRPDKETNRRIEGGKE